MTAAYSYDALGRRISKTVSGTTTGFASSGGNFIQEKNAGGTPTANLLTGGTDQTFSRTDSGGTRTFLTDALGSTVALADANGVVQTNYTYEPFGKTSVSGAASSNAQQFTGRENDGDGLYFYRARYYHPTFGRFVSEDPIGFAGGDWNLYAYVGDSPTNATDPSGRIVIAPIVGACALGAAASVLTDLALNFLGGRKNDLGDLLGSAAVGCVAGVVGLGVGKWLAKGFGALSRAAEFGIKPYAALKAALRGTGLEAHHIIEKRFAALLGVDETQMLSVAVTRAEHDAFTAAWRSEIGYGAGTHNATAEQVLAAARKIYKDYPDILAALGL